MQKPQDKNSQQQDNPPRKPSKDSFKQGYNQGVDDGKSGYPRKPHSLKNAAKFVFMNGSKVKQYVRGYHQGYDFAIKSKRIQQERDSHADQRYQQRLEQRETMNKTRNMKHDGPELG